MNTPESQSPLMLTDFVKTDVGAACGGESVPPEEYEFVLPKVGSVDFVENDLFADLQLDLPAE